MPPDFLGGCSNGIEFEFARSVYIILRRCHRLCIMEIHVMVKSYIMIDKRNYVIYDFK